MTKYLTVEEILRLHFQVLENYGGLHGVRDDGRIQSVVEAPQRSAFGTEQYSGVHEKAAVYMHNMIGGHPFSDGNKRTGIVCMGVFLLRHGTHLSASAEELEDFAVKIATDHLDVSTIAQWLEEHSR